MVAVQTTPGRATGRILAVVLVGVLSLAASGNPAQAAPPGSAAARVLVFHTDRTNEMDAAGIAAIRQAGRQGPRWQQFNVVASDSATAFSDQRLRQFNAVVFLNTGGDRLHAGQEAALRRYLAAGGGFVGVGEAARAEPESPWFTDLIGSRPSVDGPTAIQPAVVEVADRVHPATSDLPLEWDRADRWFNWDPNPSGVVHTVANLRERSYQPGAGANGVVHPISWCRDFDGGRSFYTGMGRTGQSFREPAFRRHLQGALLWTARLVRADCTATIVANYRADRLTPPNQSGQLDQIGEPHGLAIAADGRVLYIGRGGPMAGGPEPITGWDHPLTGLGEGTVHVWDPRTQQVTKAASLDVFGNWGFSQDELAKSEEGLVGIALDPDFLDNGWVYLHYTPHGQVDRQTHVGQRRVSRFTLEHGTNLIDLGSERILLSWSVQVHSCCHAGGDMAFDSAGNLYIATGDNNASGFTDGYSGNNPEPAFQGLPFADARRTAGNTNNLNGKILRIHPEPDGTYTIPGGNLFTGADAVPGKTRPEIYVMGMRNPSRISIDPETDLLTVGSVGPDALEPSPVWGPAKYDQAMVITGAGNQGWPFCIGNNQPYRDRNVPDPSQPLDWYDCDSLTNESPHNTGLVNVPPARASNLWYSPRGGAPDYPRDASGIPSYQPAEETHLLPWLTGGIQAVMDGPVYRYDESSASPGQWPPYWDGRWFVGDFFPGDGPRHAVLLDPDTAATGGLPVHADNLDRIVPEQLDAIWLLMAWDFGPDGTLYVLNYGTGFFNASAESALWRVTYVGGGATPAPGDLVPGVPGHQPADDTDH